MIYDIKQTRDLMNHFISVTKYYYPSSSLHWVCFPFLTGFPVPAFFKHGVKCRRHKVWPIMLAPNVFGERLSEIYVCKSPGIEKGWVEITTNDGRERLVKIPGDLDWQALFDKMDAMS